MKIYFSVLVFSVFLTGCRDLLILQSDFGATDGAVSAMKVAALSVDPKLTIVDLTHNIPPQNILEGAFRLYQVAFMTPENRSVFVSVVDPGVGTDRRSIVAVSKKGHIFVSPDNGTLTIVDQLIGLEEVFVINKNRWRRPGSEGLKTFDGRDLYAHLGALLASRKVEPRDAGSRIGTNEILHLKIPHVEIHQNRLIGPIPVLDPNFGNLWTTINQATADSFGLIVGESYRVIISHGEQVVYDQRLPYRNAFGDVKPYEDLLYVNSLGSLACATAIGNFAKKHGIGSGVDWKLSIERLHLK